MAASALLRLNWGYGNISSWLTHCIFNISALGVDHEIPQKNSWQTKCLSASEMCLKTISTCFRVDGETWDSRRSWPRQLAAVNRSHRLSAGRAFTSNSFDVLIKNHLATDVYYLGNSYSYSGNDGYCFELKHEHMTALFPAVVIMNRIIMLPEAFSHKIDANLRAFFSLATTSEFMGYWISWL